MLLVLTFLLSTAFPSTTSTGWMRPESFRLAIGMSRSEAMAAIENGGWDPKEGRTPDEVILDYTGERSVTLEFRRNRLRSIRFELFLTLDKIKAAFEEERSFLRKELGAPRKTLLAGKVLLYDDKLPNVMVVLSNDPKSENGRKGIGFIAVRYYDPAYVK
jgi:hypothetical protein